jgi:hypothetical protein
MIFLNIPHENKKSNVFFTTSTENYLKQGDFQHVSKTSRKLSKLYSRTRIN